MAKSDRVKAPGGKPSTRPPQVKNLAPRGFSSRGFHPVAFGHLWRTLPAVDPVETVGRKTLKADLPHGKEREQKGQPGAHGETEGCVGRELPESPASLRRPFSCCSPST